jgi:hypothetical protein
MFDWREVCQSLVDRMLAQIERRDVTASLASPTRPASDLPQHNPALPLYCPARHMAPTLQIAHSPFPGKFLLIASKDRPCYSLIRRSPAKLRRHGAYPKQSNPHIRIPPHTAIPETRVSSRTQCQSFTACNCRKPMQSRSAKIITRGNYEGASACACTTPASR